MLKEEKRNYVKKVGSLVTSVGASILLGSIGGVIIKTLGGNVVVKGLSAIGWFGLSVKLANDAANGTEEYIEDVFELLDNIKDGKEPKVLKV